MYALECFNVASTHSTLHHGVLYESWFTTYDRINFEHLFFQKKLCLLHSLLSYNNDVVSSVMEIFMHTDEYIKAYNFASVQACIAKLKLDTV